MLWCLVIYSQLDCSYRKLSDCEAFIGKIKGAYECQLSEEQIDNVKNKYKIKIPEVIKQR